MTHQGGQIMAGQAATAPPPSNEKTEKKDTHASVRRLPGGPHLPATGVHLRMPTGTAGRVLWWGGLATAAAVGIVDWPVAALIGAGSWVAEQYAKAAQRPDGDRTKG